MLKGEYNMDSTRRTVAVGVFNDHTQAEKAIDDLEQLGFTDSEIGFAWRGERGTHDESKDTGKHVGTGAVVGGILGAAAALLIPGVGPAIAGGILAPLLGAGVTAAGVGAAGAALGAAAGGVVGALTDMGVPEEEAKYYQNEFSQGRAIVTVKAGSRYMEARDVLMRDGAYDVTSSQGGTGRAAA